MMSGYYNSTLLNTIYVNPYIIPYFAYTTTDLECKGNGSDTLNRTLYYAYLWFKNNINTNITSNKISKNLLSQSDYWICQVQGNDGIYYSNYTNSSIRTIQPVDANIVLEEINMIGLMILFLGLIFVSFFLKKGSLLIMTSIFGFVLFLTETNINTILRVVMMGINLALMFIGYKMIRKQK
jgi:hypothetical protein